MASSATSTAVAAIELELFTAKEHHSDFLPGFLDLNEDGEGEGATPPDPPKWPPA